MMQIKPAKNAMPIGTIALGSVKSLFGTFIFFTKTVLAGHLPHPFRNAQHSIAHVLTFGIFFEEIIKSTSGPLHHLAVRGMGNLDRAFRRIASAKFRKSVEFDILVFLQ